jgi:hypothetical protein
MRAGSSDLRLAASMEKTGTLYAISTSYKIRIEILKAGMEGRAVRLAFS